MEIVAFRNQMEFLVLREAIQNVTDADIQRLEEINNQLLEVRKLKPVPVSEARRLELLFHDELLKLATTVFYRKCTGSPLSFLTALPSLQLHLQRESTATSGSFPHIFFGRPSASGTFPLPIRSPLNLIPVEKFESFLGHDPLHTWIPQNQEE